MASSIVPVVVWVSLSAPLHAKIGLSWINQSTRAFNAPCTLQPREREKNNSM